MRFWIKTLLIINRLGAKSPRTLQQQLEFRKQAVSQMWLLHTVWEIRQFTCCLRDKPKPPIVVFVQVCSFCRSQGRFTKEKFADQSSVHFSSSVWRIFSAAHHTWRHSRGPVLLPGLFELSAAPQDQSPFSVSNNQKEREQKKWL